MTDPKKDTTDASTDAEAVPKKIQPRWDLIDKTFRDVYNVFRDTGLSFFEVDSILTLLRTECEAAKYTYIIKSNLERIAEAAIEDAQIELPPSPHGPYN